jgi:hypothetical protein
MAWKDGEPVTVKIKRDGKEQVVKGKMKMPVEEATLRNAWLKG